MSSRLSIDKYSYGRPIRAYIVRLAYDDPTTIHESFARRSSPVSWRVDGAKGDMRSCIIHLDGSVTDIRASAEGIICIYVQGVGAIPVTAIAVAIGKPV